MSLAFGIPHPRLLKVVLEHLPVDALAAQARGLISQS
jgi:hypothetical protein